MSRKNLQHITLLTTEASAEFSKNTLYTATDGHAIELNFAAGMPPFLRGISSTMYITAPWNISHSSHFNTAEDYNAYYKRLYKNGQRHFALHLQNNRFCPQTLNDFKAIFKDIPLNEITVSFPNILNSIPALAFYIAVSESEGLPTDTLKGIINIDVLHDVDIQNSEKESSKTVIHNHWYLPEFITYAITNESLHPLNLSPEQELALMLISGNKQLQLGLNSGLDIDAIASRLSFTLASGLNHFTEISKLRAARLLWAKLIKSYHPKHENSQALHIQSTLNPNLFNRDKRDNSISESVIQATAAVFGGSQSIQTQTTDTSTQKSERIDYTMQLFLQKETQICRTVDPWAGSYVVENLTYKLAKHAWSIFETFKSTGSLPEDILNTISNINSETLKHTYSTQESSLKNNNRDENAVTHSLQKLYHASQHNKKNILTLAIDAVSSGATFNEIVKSIN